MSRTQAREWVIGAGIALIILQGLADIRYASSDRQKTAAIALCALGAFVAIAEYHTR